MKREELSLKFWLPSTLEWKRVFDWLNMKKKSKLIIPTLLISPGVVISTLGIAWIVTKSSWIYAALNWIAVGLFVLSLLIMVLKLSGFYEVLHLKNPIGENYGYSVIKVSGVLAIWAVFGVLWTGIPAITGFAAGQQEIITSIRKILEGINEILRRLPQ